jgi:hypothetical protein
MLDVAGGRDVRAAAEIGEIALFVDRDLLAFVLGDELLLIRIVGEDLLGFFGGDFLADEGDVLFGEFLHLFLDRGEIRFGDGLIAEIDIVVVAFLDGRAESEFGVRIKVDDGLRHQMRGRVIEHLEGLLAAFTNEGDRGAFHEFLAEVDELVAHFKGDVLALVLRRLTPLAASKPFAPSGKTASFP